MGVPYHSPVRGLVRVDVASHLIDHVLKVGTGESTPDPVFPIDARLIDVRRHPTNNPAETYQLLFESARFPVLDPPARDVDDAYERATQVHVHFHRVAPLEPRTIPGVAP